jgi:hypothetical protein
LNEGNGRDGSGPGVPDQAYPSSATSNGLKATFKWWAGLENLRFYDPEKEEIVQVAPSNDWWVQTRATVDNNTSAEVSVFDVLDFRLLASGETVEPLNESLYDTGVPGYDWEHVRFRNLPSPFAWGLPKFVKSSRDDMILPDGFASYSPLFDAPADQFPTLVWEYGGSEHRLDAGVAWPPGSR